MLRLTLRQARSTAGRLLLAGVAVAMGTGFVAAVLLTSALFTRTVTGAVAAQYAGADVVVRTNGEPLTGADVELARLGAVDREPIDEFGIGRAAHPAEQRFPPGDHVDPPSLSRSAPSGHDDHA